MSGNFNPSPKTFGASTGSIEEAILDGLIEGNGTGIASDVDSFAWAKANAKARAIAYLTHLNRRAANQKDPLRMTDFLPRWERILGLRPAHGTDATTRRAAVKAKMELYGQPGTQQVVSDLLTIIMGDIFVGLVHTTSASAMGYVPGGVIVPGGVTLASGGWYSTIAHLAIETVQPANIDDAAYYEAIAGIAAFLDPLLPVWVTFDAFLDGVNGAGFYLDEEKNLDNQRFD
jgi:hypothetical protein